MTLSDKVTWMTFYPGLQTNHTEMCGANISFEASI